MAKLRHIALIVPDPENLPKYYDCFMKAEGTSFGAVVGDIIAAFLLTVDKKVILGSHYKGESYAERSANWPYAEMMIVAELAQWGLIAMNGIHCTMQVAPVLID